MTETVKYAKGSHPQDLDGAVGGLVLKRAQNFSKAEDDDMHPLGTGLNGPYNEQSYAKGNGPDPQANRTNADKTLPMKKPRK